MKKIFYILILTSLLVSCVKNIDMKYPEGGGQLTLNCVLKAGQSIRANITSTLPYGQVAMSPYYKDALVTLLKNGKVVDTLKVCESRYRPEGNDSVWIYCSSHIPEVNNAYTVKAFKMGFPEVSGSTVIPTEITIKKIVSEHDDDYSEPFEITLTDNDPSENFYILQFQVEDQWGETSTAELTTEDPTINLYSYSGLIRMPLDPVSGNMAFFTDEYFVKGEKTIKLRATTNSNDFVNKIVFQSVSKSYYEYVKSLEIQKAVNENPFSEPIRIKTNIQNGFGLVGAVNETLIRF